MEFLTVYAQDRATEIIHYGIPVLINSEANGCTGMPIKLDQGLIDISVDWEHAETRKVMLENTTYEKPFKLVIMVGEVPQPAPTTAVGGPNA